MYFMEYINRINRAHDGCDSFLLLGSCSHHWYVQFSMFDLRLISYFYLGLARLIVVRYFYLLLKNIFTSNRNKIIQKPTSNNNLFFKYLNSHGCLDTNHPISKTYQHATRNTYQILQHPTSMRYQIIKNLSKSTRL